MQQLPEIQKNGSCSLTIQGIGSQSSTYPTKTWHVVSHPEGQPLPEIIKMAPAAKIFKIEAHGQLVTQSHRRQIFNRGMWFAIFDDNHCQIWYLEIFY